MSPNDAPCFPCGWVIGKNIKRRRRSEFAADGRVYVPGGGVASQASQVSALRCGRDSQGWGLRAEHPLGHESCRVSSAGELSRLPGSQRFRTACLGAGATQGTGRAGRVGADGGRGRPDPGPRALQELGPVVRALLSGRPQARPCLGKRAPGWARLRSHRKPHPGGGSAGQGTAEVDRGSGGDSEAPGRWECRCHVSRRGPHGRVQKLGDQGRREWQTSEGPVQ